MRVLLDECLPRQLKRDLTPHYARTVPEMGWAGIKNGALLRLAVQAFDVFLTIDGSLNYQQNIAKIGIAVIVMHAIKNDITLLRPLTPDILATLSVIQPGQIIHVGEHKG